MPSLPNQIFKEDSFIRSHSGKTSSGSCRENGGKK